MCDYIKNFRHILSLDKEIIDKKILAYTKTSLNAEVRDCPIIVSMTSYGERLEEVHYALFSILNQTILPDEIVLWLEDSYANKQNELPESLLNLIKYGVQIKFAPPIKSFKKIIPALIEYPNYIIVTADDDIYYPAYWLENLYKAYEVQKDCIHAHSTQKTVIKDGKLLSNKEWTHCISGFPPSYSLCPTSVGGCLYPPKVFSEHSDVKNIEIFTKLCPNQDDLWIWAMSLLNNTKINTVKNNMNNKLVYINPERELGLLEDKPLNYFNGVLGGTTKQLENLLNFYPQILDRLLDKNIKDNTINIAFVADDNYALYLGVTIQSILANKNTSDELVFYIFENEISTFLKDVLTNLVNEYSAKIIFIDAKLIMEEFNDLSQKFYISKTSYLKFVIARELPEVDKIIYLDCDLIIQSSLSELYKTNLEGNLIAGVEDVGYVNWRKTNKELKIKSFPINSGVMLIDCKKFRDENIAQKLIDYASAHGHQQYGQDQPIFNIVCENRILALDYKWNFQESFYKIIFDINASLNRHIIEASQENIIHYTGPKKPWQNPLITRGEKWLKYYYLLEKKMPKIRTRMNLFKELPHIDNFFSNFLYCLNYQRISLLSRLLSKGKAEPYKEKKKEYSKYYRKLKNIFRPFKYYVKKYK